MKEPAQHELIMRTQTWGYQIMHMYSHSYMHQVLFAPLKVFCSGWLCRPWLTVHPANADRLAEGEEEQGGATADMMVQQLEQVHPSL